MPRFDRVEGCVDLAALKESDVFIGGVGGGAVPAKWLAQAGVEGFHGLDHGLVEPENMDRQEFTTQDLGQPKAEVLGKMLRAINPKVRVRSHVVDFLSLSDEEFDERFPKLDLMMVMFDSFACQARSNEHALRRGIPAVFLGVHRNAMSAEVVYWAPHLASCYRCFCTGRYGAHEKAVSEGGSIDPPSTGVLAFDTAIPDAIGTQLALGELSRGSDCRLSQLVDQLGDRNFLHISLRPEWRVGGRDLPRELLGVAPENDLLFSWVTLARRDPNPQPCPDCEKYRGHTFEKLEDGRWLRRLPGEVLTSEDFTLKTKEVL